MNISEGTTPMSRHRRRDRTPDTQHDDTTTGTPVEEEPPTLGALQLEIAAHLDDLPADAVMVTSLTQGRLKQQMRVLSAEARAIAGAQHVKDRRAALSPPINPNEPVGHSWLRPIIEGKPHGETKAPANVIALSLTDHIARTLHRITIDLTDYDHLAHVPHLVGIEHVNQAVAHARDLTWAATEADRAALERTLAALAELADKIEAFVERRDQRSHLRRLACPHCHQFSLVAIWDQRYLRCDRVPGRRHYHPCICRESICECKTRPTTYRHTWHLLHPDGAATSWRGLARALGITDADGLPNQPTPTPEETTT